MIKIRISKNRKIIIGFILWPIIIATPQFTYHYSTGLLNGNLQFGEFPVELYLGLVSGLFAAFIIWGIAILIAKVISAISKKDFKGSSLFFIVSIVFFALTIFTQGKNVYDALTLDETKVREAQEMIKEYNSK